jgi:hypothetical protein
MFLRIARLKFAIQQKHRCSATHIGPRIIVESLPDGSIWRGRVDAFRLHGHPQTDRCYAWIEGDGLGSTCFLKLKIAPVTSAQTAVRSVLAKRVLSRRLPAR